MNELFKPSLIWFIIGLVLILSEFVLPGIVLLFFGVGAWVVCIICLVADISLNTQLVIFLVSSVLLLIFLRKWLKTMFVGKTTESSSDRTREEFVGKNAIVTKKIEPGIPGRVEIRGTQWNAESDSTIEESQPVEIVDMDNITLIVKPIKRS